MNYTETLNAARADFDAALVAVAPRRRTDDLGVYALDVEGQPYTVTVNNTKGFVVVTDDHSNASPVVKAYFTYVRGLPFVYDVQDVSSYDDEGYLPFCDEELGAWEVTLNTSVKDWYADTYFTSQKQKH